VCTSEELQLHNLSVSFSQVSKPENSTGKWLLLDRMATQNSVQAQSLFLMA